MIKSTSTMPSAAFITLLITLLITPASAFGAGNIPEDGSLDGWVWKHGDIEDVLKYVPVSFLTGYGFTKMEILRVYFGNWLRDYSQLVEIGPLTKVKEGTLRSVVSILAFMGFGIATEEFDVRSARLGCYRPEEHIDNPRGYALDPGNGEYIGDDRMNQLDRRLRHRVEDKELEIDRETGMKNYIANERINIDTSAGYLRRKLRDCIKCGREGRRGNKGDREESFIHLGALLHTLEDFSAHSNYVELVLHCLGEREVFTYVGDQCRIEVPGRGERVAPVVTGTFGSLDLFQSIIGEVDDKAAMRNAGFLTGLEARLGRADKEAFKSYVAQVANSLQYLVQFMPNANDMKRQLEETVRNVTLAKEDPRRFDPAFVDVSSGSSELWAAIKPAFDFQGNVKRFFIEYEEELRIPVVSDAKDTLDRATEELIYCALAIITEPAVRYIREVIKESKETIEKVDRESATYVNIYDEGSSASDPSHSIIAKDHFSNALNPVAGRVATATTNWAAQQIVKCWDRDDGNEDDRAIDSIVAILHHPAFVNAQDGRGTFIQNTMFDIVRDWWQERDDRQRDNLRRILNKEGIRRNADDHMHGDNNAVVDAEYFQGKRGFAVEWDGAQPELREPPRKPLEPAVVDLMNQAGSIIDSTRQRLDGVSQDFAEADKMIMEGFSSAGQTITSLPGSAGKAFTDTTKASGQFINQTTESAEQTLGKTGDAVSHEFVETKNEVGHTFGEIGEKAQEILKKVNPWDNEEQR